MSVTKIATPYLLFLGDAKDPISVKTAKRIAHWRPELCHGEIKMLELRDLAEKEGRVIHDVRYPTAALKTRAGFWRRGKRLLAVGTDCSVGKMYTSLVLQREAKSRGWNADFVATEQTGILIAGEGISIDAVVGDFISDAVEKLSLEADEDHWYLIEGQGSFFHPFYAWVSLGLLRGVQEEVFVDLDGSIWLAEDHTPSLKFNDGYILPPEPFPWGGAGQ